MAETRRSWFRPRLRTVLIATVVALVAWSGYTTWQTYSERAERRARELMAPPAGAYCTVTGRGEPGLTVSGRFVRMNREWVVLERIGSEGQLSGQFWFPRESIAHLRVDP